MSNMSNQRFLKFAGGFLAIIIAALGVWYATLTLNPEAREQRRALEELKAVEEQYKNDTFGGETPEETLELFLAALEDENIELASKYFLPDERGEIKNDLLTTQQQQGSLSGVVSRLKDLSRSFGKHNPEQTAFFTVIGEENIVKHQVVLKKNQNNIWKITDL